MLNNQNYSITAEDLEKAASVRLFEKAAAAEGINLSELSDSQVEDLYSNYQQSSEENTMNDQIIDLFEKQAAYEGIDLDALSDDELAYVYNNFITNLEDEMEEDNGEYYDEEEEAYEKLAEAEILGRHMARAYMAELDEYGFGKEAGVQDMLNRKEKVRKEMLKAMGYKSMKDVPEDKLKEFEAALTKNMKAGAGKAKAPERVRNSDGSTSLRSEQKKRIQDAFDKDQREKDFKSSARGQELDLQQQERALAKKRKDIAKKAKEERMSQLSIKEQNEITRAEALESQRKGAKTRLKKDLTKAKDYVTGKAKATGKAIDRRAQDVGQLLGGKMGKGGATSRRLRGYGALGAGVSTLGGLAYGASQMGKEASTLDLFEAAAVERAQEMVEFGKEAGFNGDHVDTFAVEILQEAGYDVSPLLESDIPLYDEEYGWY